jgi:hypothetical protein
MHNQHQQLNEGLRPMDLENMVSNLFEIDSHRSKMGEDRDICVLTFKISDRNPAKDLMEFIEKGFPFVLDSDVSAGENMDGNYFVFVELNRTPNLSEQIKELAYGIKKLTGVNEWKFKYHKMPSEFELTTESLDKIIPPTPTDYDAHLNNVRTEGVKKFFSRTLMDNLTLDGDVITIHKPFNQKIQLRLVDQGDQTVLENNTDPVSLDTASASEVFWLTKVLGDYNITKLGDTLVFDNNGQKMILQRIE